MSKKSKHTPDWPEIQERGRHAKLRIRTLCKWANNPGTLLNSDPQEVLNDLASTIEDIIRLGQKKSRTKMSNTYAYELDGEGGSNAYLLRPPTENT